MPSRDANDDKAKYFIRLLCLALCKWSFINCLAAEAVMTAAYTIGLLIVSNCFMTAAWYGHLKFKGWPLWIAVFASWGLAFFEYVFQVPANRIGYGTLSAFELKILQEAITLCIFVGFATTFLDETMTIRHGISFGLIFAAVAVAFYK